MKQATEHHTTSRRRLLGRSTAALAIGAAAVLTGGAAAAAAPLGAGADAELLALCAEFHRLHAAVNAPEAEDPVWEAALARRWAVSDLIERISATSDSGRRAKAAVAFVLFAENYGSEATSGSTARFTLAALQDVAGEIDAGQPLPRHSDAELCRLGALLDHASAEGSAAWTVVERTDSDSAEAVAVALCERAGTLARQIEAVPAKTLAGLQVKARAVKWCFGDEPITALTIAGESSGSTTDMLLLAAIVNDLLTIGRASA